MFGMTMLLFTREGRSFSVAEMREAAQSAGFDGMGCYPVPDCQFTLLVARRNVDEALCDSPSQ